VATVGGEVFFDEVYNTNPLVNAMSVGIVEQGKTVSAIASGAGNPVFIVGSATGKDGIHGATFASADITEESAEKLPSVQVGDPFTEKLLLEASLEAIQTGALVGMQDMGAAGITCSTSEMAAKGESGMRIDLEKVPARQPNMRPFELLLSESQERMLIVVKKGREADIQKVFDKWDLNCVRIGEVTDTGRLEYYFHGELVGDVPAETLVLGGGAPVYEREYTEPAYIEQTKNFNLYMVKEPKNMREAAWRLIGQPNTASKRWVYHQYDSMVGLVNLTTNEPSDAAVVRVANTESALALTVDCNSRYVHAHPYTGTMIAVCEAARNIVCSGGTPAGVTNCLNFGNPYNKEVYWQFVNAIQGMGEACTALGTPVTGGNVSFYNQSTDDGPVFPTPTIGMVGVLDDWQNRMTLDFKNAGDKIYLLGSSYDDLNSSEYLANVIGTKLSPAPHFDMNEELQLQQVVARLIKDKLIQSAHDVSDGGLYTCLLESAMPREMGFDVSTDPTIRRDSFLFGEAQSRVVVSVTKEQEDDFLATLFETEVDFSLLGEVRLSSIRIDNEGWGDIKDWKDRYDNALVNYLAGDN
jgi:phosphoribosylformylglycinamidine synthase